MILLNPHSPNRYYRTNARARSCCGRSIFLSARANAESRRTIATVPVRRLPGIPEAGAPVRYLLTPGAHGFDAGCRWDTWRNCEFNEILGFYGLAYWYTWQVSILGLGPVWMSRNDALSSKPRVYCKTACFRFGLSERAHGADIYSTEMCLIPQPDGTYLANGEKYYIGNATWPDGIHFWEDRRYRRVRLLRRDYRRPTTTCCRT